MILLQGICVLYKYIPSTLYANTVHEVRLVQIVTAGFHQFVSMWFPSFRWGLCSAYQLAVLSLCLSVYCTPVMVITEQISWWYDTVELWIIVVFSICHCEVSLLLDFVSLLYCSWTIIEVICIFKLIHWWTTKY